MRSLTWKWKKKIKVWIFLYCHHEAHNFFTASLRRYVAGIWKICIFRNPEIGESQNYGWTAEGKIQWVKGIFPANIKEKLVSKEHDDQEVWINVILEKFYSAVLYFLKIYPKVDHVVNIKLAFMDWQFCDLIIQLMQNPIKFRQSSIISEKLGYLSEKLKFFFDELQQE